MDKIKNDFYLGVFWSFASAFLWSTTFITSRYLMGNKFIDPVSLSFIRFLIGGILLFAYGYLFMRKALMSVKTKDIMQLAFLALFGVVAMSIFLFWGQQSTTAINSSMIMQMNPIIIFLGGWVIGEKVSIVQFIGIIISLLGCLFVVDVITMKGFVYDFNHIFGDMIILASATSWAIYSVFGKSAVKRLGGFAVTTWTMLFGTIELLIILLFMPGKHTLPEVNAICTWSVIAYLCIFPTAVAFFAWFEAMGKINMSLLNVMQYLTPVFTIILAFFILGEKILPLNLFGILLVIVGVVLIGCKSIRRKPRSLSP